MGTFCDCGSHVVQAFPDAHNAAEKHGLKMIYGMEGMLVDDGVLLHTNQLIVI